MEHKEQTQRSIVFDWLRIISAFAIVVLHVGSMYIDRNPVDSMNFRVANFYDSLSRFGIGMFVMISGAIFLSEQKEISIKRLWTRNILRMLIIYGVWAFGYYVFQSLYYWKYDFWNHGILSMISGSVYSSEHFWFIFMIIGLYALVPVLRSWLSHASGKEIDYLLKLFVIFQIVRTTLTILIDKDLTTRISEMVTIVEISRYLGYFVLGYALTHYDLAKKTKIVIYSLVPISILINYMVSHVMSNRQGYYSVGIYDSFGLFTFIITIALFVWTRDVLGSKTVSVRTQKVITNVAKDTLGIYLMHVALLNFMASNGWFFDQVPSVIGVPVISLIAYVICALTAAVLRRIPVVGRYLA